MTELTARARQACGRADSESIGAPPGGDGWRVALAGARGERVLTLRNTAMATSHADSQVSAEGASHVVDPRRKRDVKRQRATVVGPSARLAGAWATGLVVLGHVPDTLPPGYQAFFEDGQTT